MAYGKKINMEKINRSVGLWHMEKKKKKKKTRPQLCHVCRGAPRKGVRGGSVEPPFEPTLTQNFIFMVNFG